MQIYQVTHIETGMKKNLNKHNTNKKHLIKKDNNVKITIFVKNRTIKLKTSSLP